MNPGRTPIVDLHAHVPMQVPLPERPCDSPQQTARNQWLMNFANRFGNFLPFNRPRFDLKDAKREGVSFGSVLYVPSDELFGTCYGIENLKQQLKAVTSRLTNANYQIAANGRDFERKVSTGTPTVFHCLEGGFSIEHPEQVDVLAECRVAYVVLAHLLFRDIAACVNAFPFFTDEAFDRMFPMPQPGLTERGRDICVKMCARGIIPDVTHMTTEAAHEVFAIAKANRPSRPVIVSHGAPRGTSANEYKLNLSSDIIRNIRDSEGVIGVIWFNHWLLPTNTPPNTKATIDDVVAAVARIADIAGDTRSVAVGSDLDGFIKPVTGLEAVGKIRSLEAALLKRFTDEEVKGILWKNATRTLARGWE